MKLDRIIAVRNDKTVYHDGDRCLKIFDNSYSDTDVLNEALNQVRVRDTGLRVPKILEIILSDSKPTIVSEYIEGKTLARLMEENPAQKEEYLKIFVGQQCEIHSKTCPALTDLHEKMACRISNADLPDAVRHGLLARLKTTERRELLCHGDFDPSNIIISDNGAPYIIDWSHATRGNPAAEAAGIYLRFLFDGGTECAERYLELFSEKCNTAKRQILEWIPLVAASQLSGGNADERRFLRKWINIDDKKNNQE